MSGSGILEADNIINMEWRDEIAQVVVDEWIVRFVGNDAKTDQLADSLTQYGFEGVTVRGLGGNGFGVISLAGVGYEPLAAWAQQQADVLYVEPNFVHVAGEVIESTTPNDGSFSSLWGLNNTGQTGGTVDADIDAVEAWDLTTGSSDVVIAIIDTGIDYTHPDLVDNMWVNPGEIAGDGIDNDGNGYIDDVYGWDFANDDSDPVDGHSHGTHCAGTIGGVGNNSLGVAGVNWNVKLMALKFLSDSGWGYTSDAIGAVNYATMMKRDYGVNVIATSNSWGGGGSSSAMADAIAAAGNEGILFVAAAGNSGSNNDISPHYPSNYDLDNVISVAATDHNDNMAYFSSYGATTVDLGAPGVSIYSTVLGGGYASYSGTSMATPHVSGVIGLMAALNPEATISEIKTALMDGTDPLSSLAGRTVSGGRLNAYESLQLIGTGEDTTGPTVTSVSPTGQVGPTSQLSIIFNEDLSAASVVAGSFSLRGSGADGVFDTGDDRIITISGGMVSQSQADRATIDLGSDLAVDTYRLTIRGTGGNAIQDEAGNALNDGSDTTHSFEVIQVTAGLEPDDILSQANDTGLTAANPVTLSGTIGDGSAGSRDVDMYAVQVNEAMVLRADIDAAVSGSSLNSVLRVFDANGNELTFNVDMDGTDSFIEFRLPGAGTYYVGVSGFGNFSYSPTTMNRGVAGSTGEYLLWLSLATPDNSGASIGPDSFGYTARTAEFGFEDISSFGTTGLSYGDDRYFTISTGSLPGFEYDFYGRDQGNLYVSSNGLVTFGGAYTSWSNTNLTTSPTYSAIVPLWDDLVVDSSGSVYWSMRGTGDQQRLIIQWDDVRFYGHSGGGSDNVTFQTILYEVDNSIRFNYMDVTAGNHHSGGASASVGIKDSGAQSVGADMLQISINSGANGFVGTGLSTLIKHNAAPVLSLTNQVMSHTEDTRVLTLLATDADGDAVSYDARLISSDDSAAALRDQLGLTWYHRVCDNARGWGAKYLLTPQSNWYYVLADGSVHEIRNHQSQQRDEYKVGDVDLEYYADPDAWLALPSAAPDVTLSLDGDQLTIDPGDGFLGDFQVEVSASDGQATVTDTFTVTVGNVAPEIASLTGDSDVQGVQAANFSASANDADGDSLTYTWNFGDGSATVAGINLTDVSHTYGDGQYSVTLTVTDGHTGSDTATHQVTVTNAAPTLSIADQTMSHTQDTRVLTLPATDADGDAVTYDARLSQPSPAPDVTLSVNGNELTIDPGDGFLGDFQVEVSASDGQATVTDTFAVTVRNMAPEIASLTGDSDVQGVQAANFSASANDADGDSLTYTWNFGDGSATVAGINLTDVSHTYADGQYSVTLTVADGYNGSDTATHQVTVTNVAPTLSIADQAMSHTEDSRVLTLTATDADGDAVSYGARLISSGDPDVTLSVNGNELTIDPADGFVGDFQVEVSASDGAATSTDTFTVTVGNVAPEIASLTGDSDVQGVNAANFSASANDADGDSLTYTWDFGDGSAAVAGINLTDVSHTYADGQYSVTLTVTDGHNGSDTATHQVTVTNAPPTLSIADQAMSHTEDSRVLTLAATDADGDAVSYSARLISSSDPAAALRDRLGLVFYHRVCDSARGWGAKYLLNAQSKWYYLLADGSVHEIMDHASQQRNEHKVGDVGTEYYADPDALLALPPAATDVALSVDGNELTIDPGDGFLGDFQVQVSASDGAATSTDTFTVTVGNVAPEIASLTGDSDVQGVQAASFSASANDTDGDSLTYTWNFGDGSATVAGINLTDVSHTYGDGQYSVTLSVTDGHDGSDTATHQVTVTNTAPTLSVADQTMSNTEDTRVLTLAATDADGDAVTYDARLISSSDPAAALRDELGLTWYHRVCDNARGWGEKYLLDAESNWYYMLADGSVHEIMDHASQQRNEHKVGQVNVQYYADPDAWLALPSAAPDVTLSLDGDQLTIDPGDGFLGDFQVQVSASDGAATVRDTFTVTVTN